MSPCNEWHKRIVKCIDNEADEKERFQAAEHIKVCSACQVFHERYSKIKQAYSTVSEPVLSGSIRDKVLNEIQKDITDSNRAEAEPRSRRFTWRLTMGKAAVIFLIVSLATVCTLLVRSNSALKKDLQYAYEEVASLQQQKQFLSAQNRQQEAITDLRGRVRDLEGHVRLGISPRIVWQSESPYYQPEIPGKL